VASRLKKRGGTMKKKTLKLRAETVRHLSPEKLRDVAGGATTLYCSLYCTMNCPTQQGGCTLPTHTTTCPQ
jgi:hypothetical protein